VRLYRYLFIADSHPITLAGLCSNGKIQVVLAVACIICCYRGRIAFLWLAALNRRCCCRCRCKLWQSRQQHCRCFQSSFKKTATPQSGFFVFSLAFRIFLYSSFRWRADCFFGNILKNLRISQTHQRKSFFHQKDSPSCHKHDNSFLCSR
jgi:hypothetical protein